MKSVPLSQFMPYGAPELLGVSRRHMMQALMLSSALCVATFAVVGLVRSRMPPPVVELKHDTVFDLGPILVPPIVPPRDFPRVRVAPKLPDVATPNPTAVVEDPARTLPDLDDFRGSADGPTGADATSGEPDVTTTPGGGPPPPKPGEWVYVDELPQAVVRVEPDYPDIAREAQVSGVVAAQLLVGTDGRVHDVLIDAKRSIPMLNDSVLAAARRWVFKPGLVNKHPVAVWVGVQFNFKLH